MNFRHPVLLLLLLITAGCTWTASSPPSHYYILPTRPVPAAAFPGMHWNIGVEPVKLPRYLDRPQIVTVAGQGEVRLAEFHRWAEPLRDGFTRLLIEGLNARFPEGQVLSLPARHVPIDWSLTIEVIQFHVHDNHCLLQAKWRWRQGQKTLVTRRAEIRIPVADTKNFPAIVPAMAQAVDHLADKIARDLARTFHRPALGPIRRPDAPVLRHHPGENNEGGRAIAFPSESSLHLSVLMAGSGKGLPVAMEGRSGLEFTDEFRSGRPFPDSEKAN